MNTRECYEYIKGRSTVNRKCHTNVYSPENTVQWEWRIVFIGQFIVTGLKRCEYEDEAAQAAVAWFKVFIPEEPK